VVSQVEQLAQSRCVQQSGGKLWCATCHDPHDPSQLTTARQREICQSCHKQPLDKSHPASAEDCATCHMPRTPTPSVAHTAYTDHRIRRTPPKGAAEIGPRDPDLLAWHEPAAATRQRNLGLAYLTVALEQRSLAASREGLRILSQLEEPPADDPALLEALGEVLLGRSPPAAVQLLAQALRKRPENANLALNLGLALESSVDAAAAAEQWNHAISIDPSFGDAYLRLADYYAKNGQPDLRRQTLQRYPKFMPQSLVFRQALQ
jgi:predicted CXXCH cytochrome family protein